MPDSLRNRIAVADDLAYNLDQLANVSNQPAAQPDPDEPTITVPSLASMRRRRSA